MPPATAHRTSPAPLDALRRHLPLAAISLIVLISLVGTIVLLRDGTVDAASLLDAVAGEVERNYLAMLALFALWSFATLLLVIPGGTISLFAAGFLFGWAPAAAVYVAMILPTTLILDGIGRRQLGARLATYLAATCRRGWRSPRPYCAPRVSAPSSRCAWRRSCPTPSVPAGGIARHLTPRPDPRHPCRRLGTADAGRRRRQHDAIGIRPAGAGAVDFRLLLHSSCSLGAARLADLSRLQRLRADRPVAEAA